MSSNNVVNKVIFYNYLEDSWKEERNIAWRLVKKNNIFFNSLRKNGLLINKSSNINYKQQFLVAILSQYLYSVKQHLKLYSLFLLFFKTFKINLFYKNNSLYIKKKKIGYFRKFTIKKYKKYYLIWYKKWFRKKYKKYRKILWKQFHRVPENFWSKLLKKRSKIFIFNILKSNFFKKKLFIKNYNQIIRIFFFFIKRRKGKRVSRKKLNKKYRINITIPLFLQKIKYLQKKTYKQAIFPYFKKKNDYLKEENNTFPISIFYNKVKHLFFFHKKLYFFFINYNYFFYFLNLKNKNIFNKKKDILINYYKTLASIYKNKKIKKYSFIRTCILKKKLNYSDLRHGNNTNIFFFWQDNFLKKFLISYRYILNNLFKYLNNNQLISKNKYTYKSIINNTIISNISFIITNKKNIIDKKKNIKFFFLLHINKCNKKKKMMINIKNNWYKNVIKKLKKKKKYKRYYNLNRKMFFYPFRIKFRKKIYKNYINRNNLILKKKFFIYKKFINKNLFINNEKQYNFFNNKIALLKKKKRHFLKKYKKKIKKKLYFKKYKKNKLNFFSNKKIVLTYKKNNFFFSKNNKVNKKYNLFKKKYILFKKLKNKISYKKLNKLFKHMTNEYINKLLKINTSFILKKKKYIFLFNIPFIYKEFLIKMKFKLKNKRFNKYRRTLKFIKYKLNLDTVNIYKNLYKYDKFNININNKNKDKFIYNIFMLCNDNKYVYSNLLINYKKWLSIEISKNLFFKWIDIINNIKNTNNTKLSYKNYLIKY